jgi:hypothetical protein
MGSRVAVLFVVLALTGGALLFARDGGARTTDGCHDERSWPFESFSCHIYQETGSRARLAEDISTADVPVSPEQAVQVVLERNPGAELREVRLVYVWSDEGDYKSDRQLVWAVSLELPNGPFMSTGSFYFAELQNFRSPGDSRPLSLEGQEELERAVSAKVDAVRAQITEEYHLDFIDPSTGEWLGGAEGAG